MINPTIALTAPSSRQLLRTLASRYHIHTVITSHQPRNVNMSQDSAINESIVVMQRHNGAPISTKCVNLDRMPRDETDAAELHRRIQECPKGLLADGWGEVSWWPATRIEAGDWTPAIWRSPVLAEGAADYAHHPELIPIHEIPNIHVHRTGPTLFDKFKRVEKRYPGALPLIKSKGSEAQTRIQSNSDEYWVPKDEDADSPSLYDGVHPEVTKFVAKSANLLITEGQNINTARVTAVADDEKYVGGGWMPITGMSAEESKAVAVFLNSTPGRLQLMNNSGRTILYPIYRPAGVGNIRLPDLKDDRIRSILSACWERTKDMLVPQFRDGECEVRRLWDEAVAKAMGWDPADLTRQRLLLHREPHVRGKGYNEYD